MLKVGDEMQPSKLGSHKLIKGRFVTPFNEIGTPMSDEESWVYGRLPEYIWIGLIFDYYGRNEALYKLREILQLIKKQIPSLHRLLSYYVEMQRKLNENGINEK